MGWRTNLAVVSAAVAVALLMSGVFNDSKKPIPKVADKWWGKGDQIKPDGQKIHNFKISVPDSVLQDLKRRLESARLPESMEGTAFHYGFRSQYLSEVISYWKDKYNWRYHEKLLNSFDHHKTQIEGINIHFIHVKPPKHAGKRRVMLLIHGWPGSVYEFYKILPMLSDPSKYGGIDEDAVEIVAPSIPGFGYSEAAHKPGLSAVDAGRIFRKLMLRLGHEKFYVQAGDFGAIITTLMAHLYPENILGFHLNMVPEPTGGLMLLLKKLVGYYFPSLVWSANDIPKIYPIMDRLYFMLEETGYLHIQATKPDTVGVGLNDSPAGLAAYMLEKFTVGTNKSFIDLPDGGLTRHFTIDELLTNVMLYWTTGTITSSTRLYKELFHDPLIWELESYPVHVPASLACFPEEVMCSARSIAATKFLDIVQYTDMPSGGHFGALQEPLLLAQDVWSFIQKLENRNDNRR